MPLYTSEVSVDNTPLPVSVSSALPAGTNLIGHVITDAGSTVSISNATIAVTQSTSPWVVSGTVTSNIGTTNGLALDATVSATQGTVAAGTAATKSTLIGGQFNTVLPTLTTGQQAAFQMDTNGRLLVDIGTSTIEQNTNLNQVGGSAITIGQATMAASLPVVIASNQSAIPVTLTSTTITGTVAVTQSTSPWVVSGTVTSNIGTTNGLALDATVAKLTLAQGSTTSGQTGALVLGAVTTAAPTYVTAQSNPLSLMTTGALRTDTSSWLGSTAPTVGSKTSANSIPVVIASDQAAIPVTSTPTTVASATVTSVSVSTTVATLLASRAARISAVIFNEAGTLFVKAGSAASSSDYTWRMTANTELDISGYTGIVTATKSAGTTNAQVTDF